MKTRVPGGAGRKGSKIANCKTIFRFSVFLGQLLRCEYIVPPSPLFPRQLELRPDNSWYNLLLISCFHIGVKVLWNFHVILCQVVSEIIGMPHSRCYQAIKRADDVKWTSFNLPCHFLSHHSSFISVGDKKSSKLELSLVPEALPIVP